MAGGVVAALSGPRHQGRSGLGQDGDRGAEPRRARHADGVVWKDSRDLGREAATAAMALASGKKVDGAVVWAEGEKKVKMDAIFSSRCR